MGLGSARRCVGIATGRRAQSHGHRSGVRFPVFRGGVADADAPRRVHVHAGCGRAPDDPALSFGAALVDRRAASGDAGVPAIACAVVAKLAVQPAIACGVGMLLGLTGPALMSVTIMAALPSAQNAYIAATRAKAGERIAQGTVLVTTFASLPVVVGIAAIFHALGVVG